MQSSCDHECYYPPCVDVGVVWPTNISVKVSTPAPTYFIQAATSKCCLWWTAGRDIFELSLAPALEQRGVDKWDLPKNHYP